MQARTRLATFLQFVLLSFVGSGVDAQSWSASAAADSQSSVAAAAPAAPNAAVSRTPAPPGEERVYEVLKQRTDFPDREDLSTPEAAYVAIHRAAVEEGTAGFKRLSVLDLDTEKPWPKDQPLPKEMVERFLNYKILEVHIWDEINAAVIARMPRENHHDVDVRWLRRVDGRWLNEGNGWADIIEEAREMIARSRLYKAAKQLRDNRPPIADPPAHLRPFVDFLKREAKDPQRFVFDALEAHRLVIVGEIHHRPRYWAFNAALLRSPEFARRVGVIYLELPSHAQPLVDRFLTAAAYDAAPIIEMLRDTQWLGWPDQPMLDFFRTVWDINQDLPEPQRLRIVLTDAAQPWKEIKKRDDWREYEVDRDQYMADNIVRDLEQHATDKRHGLFIVGYGHAMANLTYAIGDPMKSAGWHLREKLGESNVFAIFPHGPVITNMGQVSGRLALGLFDTAFAAMGNKPMAFPLDRGPFGQQIFDADPERLTRDPYGKGYHAYLYLGPLEEEVFSPLIPGFYSDDFVRELDRRLRVTDGKGLVEAGIVRRLDGDSFTAWMGRRWGQPRRDWSADRLGPLEAWRHGSRVLDAMRKRVPSPSATTGNLLELYDIRSGRESLANLEEGTVMAPEPERFRGDNAEGRAWLQEKGIDLIAYAATDAGDQGIAGYGMAAVKIDNSRFDALGVAEARRALENVEKDQKKAPATLMSIKAGLPVTYAIRTREGSVGVLQIEDARLSERPAVFRLRYRLFVEP